jgi:aldose 1-epimerase
MVPFANRISGGGFHHGGQFHRLEPNRAGDKYPNHGNGFQSAWTAEMSGDANVRLTLRSDGPGPFRYDATLDYALQAGALTMQLTVTNRGAIALPFGAGFHPWFARTRLARLTFAAAGCWSESSDHLPDRYTPLPKAAGLDFSAGRALPAHWINMAFTGWDGMAELHWPERGWGVTLAAGPPLSTLMLYSPSGDAATVCIEPVSHSVDAHNRSEPGTAPPQVLTPGADLVIVTTITPQVSKASGSPPATHRHPAGSGSTP